MKKIKVKADQILLDTTSMPPGLQKGHGFIADEEEVILKPKVKGFLDRLKAKYDSIPNKKGGFVAIPGANTNNATTKIKKINKYLDIEELPNKDVIMYHGTSNLKQIKRDGQIDPRFSKNESGKLFVTPDKIHAKNYAQGKDGGVVKVVIPRKEFDKMLVEIKKETNIDLRNYKNSGEDKEVIDQYLIDKFNEYQIENPLKIINAKSNLSKTSSIKRIDQPTRKEIESVIDYVRLKKPYSQKMEEVAGILAERYNLKSKKLSDLANNFESLLKNTK